MDGWFEGIIEFLENPTEWEIYRGDEFQLEIKNQKTLAGALRIKAYFKTLKLDARIVLVLETKHMQQIKFLKVTELLLRSGEVLNFKETKINLAINSSDEAFNAEINMMLRLSLTLWTIG
jgi:hypothetical protein